MSSTCPSMHQAIVEGNIEDLKKLLGRCKLVDVTDNSGCSPLHGAVLKNRKNMVEVLVNHPSIEINRRNFRGHTSLYFACDLPDTDLNITRDILNHGADPNIPDNKGVSPLHLACKRGNLKLVELLIRHQADVNSQDRRRSPPLHYAIKSDSPEIAKFLLAHDADANMTDVRGYNALMLHQQDCVDLLLARTQNLDALTRNGWTALLLAISSAKVDAARALLEHGASLTAHTCQKSALEVALTCEDYATFELIWRHTDLDTVSENRDFLRLVCKQCSLPRCYKHYRLILNAHDVELHVAGASGFFWELFQCAPPTGVHFDSAKSQYLNVVGWLLDRGAQLELSDITQILWYFRLCLFTVELWNTIFAKTTPNIPEQIVAKAIDHRNYELALLLATYCLHLNPEGAVDFEAGLDETFLRNWLALFTPASQHRQKIGALTLVCESASAKKVLTDTPQVRSLLEASRDAVRQAMQTTCTTTRDFLTALEKLDIPIYLKDVIRLRVPVNRHLLED